METFEKFLQKHFGLAGGLYRQDIDLNADLEPEEEFTKEGWDAWGRYIDMVKDMRRVGLIGESMEDALIDKVWDIVYEQWD